MSRPICVVCRGPRGENSLELEFTQRTPTTTFQATAGCCLSCAHTRNVTLAHLYELARRDNERSTRRAETPPAAAQTKT